MEAVRQDLVPQTVLAVKPVELALISFTDEENKQMTTLAVIGDNLVHILEGRTLGFSKNTTRQGVASKWLRDGVFKALGKPIPKED